MSSHLGELVERHATLVGVDGLQRAHHLRQHVREERHAKLLHSKAVTFKIKLFIGTQQQESAHSQRGCAVPLIGIAVTVLEWDKAVSSYDRLFRDVARTMSHARGKLFGAHVSSGLSAGAASCAL